MSNSTFRKAALPVLLFAFLVCSFLAGISFGVTCLQDPDTCWMLKMGEVINREKSIPKKDPFSFNAQTPDGKPHVYYQWLSEVAFDHAQNLGQFFTGPSISKLNNDPSLKGPMLLGAFLCAGAFLAFPFLFFFQAPKRFLILPVLILAGAQASSFHFYLRPELFSAFMFSLELLVLNRIRLAILADPHHYVSRWSILLICLMMVVWCNLHCGFVLGWIILLLFSVTQSMRVAQPESKHNIYAMLGLGTLCTLINPWWMGLWGYLLKLFTSPVGARVEELQPLSIFEFVSHTYSLYIVFALASLVLLLFTINKLKSKQGLNDLLFSCIAVAMILVMGIGARRLIPFACILGVFEWTMILSILHRYEKVEEHTDSTKSKLSRIWAPGFSIAICTLTVAGTWWESGLFKLQLPQASYGFPAPYEAIGYLQSANQKALEYEKIRGQCLNDPQFGDMMIYYLGSHSVFIDTRFDIYQDKIVFDFLTMANCQNGWDKLLDQYKIAWIFLPQHTQLATFARNHPDQWTTIYSDESALISRRKNYIR
ncbi:MAG: hypothetical protein SFY67_07360 [Candidatus Melainabacteria bacterium]|nr:hypothetical protein [Candidatus Melainabacteria bacterium]